MGDGGQTCAVFAATYPERTEALGDRAWRELLYDHHIRVRRRPARFRGEELDTAGDGFFASFDGPARAISCARAIVGAMSEPDLSVRAGIHTGECEIQDGKVTDCCRHRSTRCRDRWPTRSARVEHGQGSRRRLGLRVLERGLHELKGVLARGSSMRSQKEQADLAVVGAMPQCPS